MTHFLLPFRTRTYAFIVRYWLSLGLLVLITGLFWSKDGSQFTKFYYALIAAPALLACLCRPEQLAKVLREPTILAYLMLSAWLVLSLTWSSTDNSVGSLLKRPVYVFMLFIALALMALQDRDQLMRTLRICALFAAFAVLVNLLIYHFDPKQGERMIGTGALHNPLLTSHLLGFVCTYWIAAWVSNNEKHQVVPIILVSMVLPGLLATGSRTPLLALVLTSLWLMVMNGRRAFYLALALLAGVLLLLVVHPEALLNRGASYRPELWSEAIRQAIDQLWLGGGFDSKFLYEVPGTGLVLSDPHNVELAVLMELGLVGLGIWAVMYGLLFWRCLEERNNAAVQITSALVVYGIGAGLTEGGNFLSRPNESWFLVWIPLALCCALSIQRRHS